MKKRLLALFCALAVGGAVTAKTVGATSPGGNLRMEIEVADKISYTVWSGADKVLDACTLSRPWQTVRWARLPVCAA